MELKGIEIESCINTNEFWLFSESIKFEKTISIGMILSSSIESTKFLVGAFIERFVVSVDVSTLNLINPESIMVSSPRMIPFVKIVTY